MKILSLSPLDPIPINSGLRERIYQTAKYLGKNHNVHLLHPYEPTRANSQKGRIPTKQPFKRIELKHPVLSWLDRFVPHYSPLRGLYKTHPWLYRSIRNRIIEFNPDVIMVEMPFLVPVALAARRGRNIPVVLTEHNIQFKVTERLGIPGTMPLKLFETAVANQADLVVTVSEVDKETLSNYVSATELAVSPNGVNVDRFNPSKSHPELKEKYGLESPIFVYHGSLGNAQNSEAVNTLLERIFPALRDEFPDAQLLLIGGNPPEINQQGIIATGIVDDLAAHIAMADVATIPLQSGSGTKLKILEYMATGVPVVTTSIGAEGIPIEDETHVAIENEWESFVQQASRAIWDEEWSSSMAQAGRELIETQFSWRATLKTYDTLEEIVHQNSK